MSSVPLPVASAETAQMGVPAHGWMMFAGLAHPQSRGVVRLSGPDVTDPVVIEANTLSHPDDLRAALVSIDCAAGSAMTWLSVNW